MSRLRLWPLLFSVFLAMPSHGETLEVPLCLHIAQIESISVCGATWLEEVIEVSNQLLGEHGIRLEADTYAVIADFDISDAKQRDDLVTHYREGCLNVFVVRDLINIGDSGGLIGGVRWRYRGDLSKSYVILSVHGADDVLAHEIGHFLGLGHNKDPQNLMCDGALFHEFGAGFTKDQGEQIYKKAKESFPQQYDEQ